jgi:hypothetical protein
VEAARNTLSVSLLEILTSGWVVQLQQVFDCACMVFLNRRVAVTLLWQEERVLETLRDYTGSPLPSKLRISTPSGAFKKGAKDQRFGIRPQRTLLSPEEPCLANGMKSRSGNGRSIMRESIALRTPDDPSHFSAMVGTWRRFIGAPNGFSCRS